MQKDAFPLISTYYVQIKIKCKFDTNANSYKAVIACSHHGQINHPLLYCKKLPPTHKPDSCS